MKKLIKLIFAFVFISNPAFTEDLSVAWETEASFKLPESVIYDKKNDLLYVSNIANHPFKKDGSGFISKVNMQGEIVELEWIKKLNESSFKMKFDQNNSILKKLVKDLIKNN